MLEKAWKLLERVFLARVPRITRLLNTIETPRQVLRRAAEGVRQICLGIRGIKSDGSLGAGQHNRLRTTLDQIAQGRRRIRHGVRAVGDDKAVIAP